MDVVTFEPDLAWSNPEFLFLLSQGAQQLWRTFQLAVWPGCACHMHWPTLSSLISLDARSQDWNKAKDPWDFTCDLHDFFIKLISDLWE